MTEGGPAMAAPGSLIGRDAELQTVLDAVERAPTAGLVGVLLLGEAGIGKSRLLTEVAARLAARGWRVLSGRADQLERQIPYATLGALVQSPAATPADPATADLQAEAVAALHLPGESPGEASFGRACQAVTELVTALSESGPVLVALDDLHQLDDDSLALLTIVLRRASAAPVAFAGTVRSHLVRPHAALEEMLERLEADGELSRVELAPLGPDDVGAVVAPILGAPADDALLREVHDRTGGNPFFATEIARSLAEQHLIAIEDERARLTVQPHAVRVTRHNAVLRRVIPLSREARLVARAVSVFRRVRLDQMGLISHVTELPDQNVGAAFDDLLRAKILVWEPDRGYRFSHDLVADCLYEDVGPAERRHLHGLIAERMVEDRAKGLAVDVLEVAWHVSESAAPGDDAAIDVLTEAAARVRAAAPETAASFCARALGLLAADDVRRATLLSLQARAHVLASKPALAVEPGKAALALLPPGPERDHTAMVVVGSLFSAARMEEALRVADEAIAEGGGTAVLRAQRACILVLLNRDEDALDEAAYVESLRSETTADQVVTLSYLAMLASMTIRHDTMLDYLDRQMRVATVSKSLELQAAALSAVTTGLCGLVRESVPRLHRAEALTQELGGHAFRGEMLVTRLALDWLEGRWDSALESTGRVVAELDALGQATLIGAPLLIELDIRTWRGELDLASRLASERPVLLRNLAGLHAWARSAYHLVTNDIDGVRRIVREAVADPTAAGFGCLLLGRLVEVELDEGNPDAAAEALELLTVLAENRLTPWSKTTLYRATGLVQRDSAMLRVAVAEARDGGLVVERARAQLALGEVDGTAVADLLEAYQTFGELGAHGLRRRAGRRLRELGAKVPRKRSRPPGLLTEAEQQIARLVQQGMRNRDIAAALHYSPRTIEVYLSRIYSKLQVSSRLELARALDTIDMDDKETIE